MASCDEDAVGGVPPKEETAANLKLANMSMANTQAVGGVPLKEETVENEEEAKEVRGDKGQGQHTGKKQRRKCGGMG